MNEKKAVKVAIDIPSGICAGTGAALGAAFSADYTVTFQTEKLGLVRDPVASIVPRAAHDTDAA